MHFCTLRASISPRAIGETFSTILLFLFIYFTLYLNDVTYKLVLGGTYGRRNYVRRLLFAVGQEHLGSRVLIGQLFAAAVSNLHTAELSLTSQVLAGECNNPHSHFI